MGKNLEFSEAGTWKSFRGREGLKVGVKFFWIRPEELVIAAQNDIENHSKSKVKSGKSHIAWHSSLWKANSFEMLRQNF